MNVVFTYNKLLDSFLIIFTCQGNSFSIGYISNYSILLFLKKFKEYENDDNTGRLKHK